jgi:hypothetical protein
LLVCLGICASVFSQILKSPTKLTRAEIANQILLVASGEIGVQEKTGRNDGVRINAYRSAVSPTLNLKKYLDPYCGFFVYWCFTTYGLKPSVRNPGRASDWFLDKNRNQTIALRGNTRRGNKILPGMTVGYRFYGNRISHVGLLERWDDDDDYCITIEANTSAANIIGVVIREGDGVYRKKRRKRMIAVISDWIPSD